jgi:hypothetical protein
MRFRARFATLPIALVAVTTAGCSGVEVGPHSAANEKATASIEAAGGDPADWRVDNECAAAGPCEVELSSVQHPGKVVARNSYRVKDSFPWPLGRDEIRMAVARAEQRPSR